jgi:hypothetical protein
VLGEGRGLTADVVDGFAAARGLPELGGTAVVVVVVLPLVAVAAEA